MVNGIRLLLRYCKSCSAAVDFGSPLVSDSTIDGKAANGTGRGRQASRAGQAGRGRQASTGGQAGRGGSKRVRDDGKEGCKSMDEWLGRIVRK